MTEQYTGTMLDELLAKVDEALETGRAQLSKRKPEPEHEADNAELPHL